MSPGPEGPNADQIRYWTDVSGPAWRDRQRLLDDQLGPLGRAVMDRCGVAPGERVLDVGCGCGDSTLELGRRVGRDGQAVGVDISPLLLDVARTRAAETGASNVRFREADAQTADLGRRSFDLVFSRFGVMFFADPVAAFANLLDSLYPNGRLAFVCWRSMLENPWMAAPAGALASHLPLPPPPPPGTPGPFSLADGQRLEGILDKAGFDAIDLERWDGDLLLGGGSLSDAVALFMEVGPAAALLRETRPAEDLRPRIEEAIRRALEPYDRPDGIRMPAAAWIVQAHRPAAAA